MAQRPGDRWAEHVVAPEEAGRTLEELLTGSMGVSRRALQRLTRSRGIRVDGRPGFLARKVRGGETVAVRVAADEEPGLEAVAMDLSIVHQDTDCIVVDKPPFLLVHPTSPAQTRTLAHGIAHHLQAGGVRAKVRPVHRIDRDTSGLVLFATTASAHAALDRQLRERTMRREYLALVEGEVQGNEGTIDAPIGRHKTDPTLRAVRPQAGEPAVTHFRVADRLPGATLVALELETGRTHQIRVHMAHVGHPVFGDRQYGGPAVPTLRRQALHASRLSFAQPTSGEEIVCDAPLPQDLAAVVERVRSGTASS